MKNSSEIRPEDWSDKISVIGLAVLERWFDDENPENRDPNVYVRCIDKVIFILLKFWVDSEDNDYMNNKVKIAIDGILQIKDDLLQLMIDPGNGKQSK